MKLGVFCVLDHKASFFGKPFFHDNSATAMREFADAVNDDKMPNNLWARHPEDYSLYEVGSFDSISGELTGISPVSLVTASAIKSIRQLDDDLFPAMDFKPKKEVPA